jgi:hypothetical protein
MKQDISAELFQLIYQMEAAVANVLGHPDLPPRLYDKTYTVWCVVSGSDYGFKPTPEVLRCDDDPDDGGDDGEPMPRAA